jgi:predicted phage-related endonuclease
MTVTYYPEMVQGSDEWHQARCGILTASNVSLILTPTLKVANNDKARQHVYEIAAQRLTGYVEPSYMSDDMLRGYSDEILARDRYSKEIAHVRECGIIKRDFGDFVIGYSPDGCVGDDGGIEVKSRRQKYQIETITSWDVPQEYILQVQTGLVVTGWEYLDYISYCGGLPMAVIRVEPDVRYHDAIINAAGEFERKVQEVITAYEDRWKSGAMMFETERVVEDEMVI